MLEVTVIILTISEKKIPLFQKKYKCNLISMDLLPVGGKKKILGSHSSYFFRASSKLVYYTMVFDVGDFCSSFSSE